MSKTLLWLLRVGAAGTVALVLNYYLFDDRSDVLAHFPQNYAIVQETNQSPYTGVQSDMWFGDPDPCCPNPTFSNGTLWAVQTAHCAGLSWVETGWYEGWRSGVFGRYYKFIYKVPGQNNCTYTETNVGGVPDFGDTENFRLERYAVGQWRWYWQGFHTASVQTGWSSGLATRVDSGGEVGQAGNGMQGANSNLKYRRSLTWFTWSQTSTDWSHCDSGYSLWWPGTDDISFGNVQGGC